MKNLKAVLFLAALFFSTTFAGAASMNQLKGTYVNTDSETKGITKINLKFNNGVTQIQTFGSCSPTDCDWGTTNAMVYGQSVASIPVANVQAIQAEYEKSHANTTLVIIPLANNQLMVTSMTTFKDGSGRKPYAKTFRMKRQIIIARPVGTIVRPTIPSFLKEDLIGFNAYNLRIVPRGSIFLILDGNHSVFSAPNYTEAKKIVNICRNYGINKQGFVGRPNPSLTYLLRGAQAPVGAMANEDCLSFNPDNLEVQPAGGGSYRLVDGSHYLFSFPNQAEAIQSLKVIQKYGFTKTCYVGRPGPSLQYLRK